MMADRNDVKEKMASLLHLPVEKLQESAVLTDLVSDSMILVNMVIELQEEFGVRMIRDDLKDVKTLGDLLALFDRKLA